MAKKNSEQKVVKSFYLSQDQAQKIRYVESKSDQYERSYACLKFHLILSRATREIRTNFVG